MGYRVVEINEIQNNPNIAIGVKFPFDGRVLFEPNTPGLKEFIEETISSAINYWLPYIQISNLDIVTIEDDPNMIHEIKVSLTFIVTKTNSEQTITIFAGQDGIVRIE